MKDSRGCDVSIAAERARELLAGITPGPWERRIGPGDQTPAEFIAGIDGVDGEPLHVVIAPSPEDRYAYVVPAITGNGPTSRVNAEFIAAAPELARDLLAELDQARAVAEWLIAEKLWETRIETDRLEIVNDWLVMREVYPLEYPAGPEYGAMPYSDSEPLVHLSEIPGWDRTTLAAERDAALATLREVRDMHTPHDGEWYCGESPDCETCASGGSHEGQVCTLCTHEDWDEGGVVIWPCHTARLIDAILDRGPR